MLGKFVILSLFIAGAMADCNDCKAAVGAIYQGLQTQEVQDNIVELVASVFGCSEPETRQLDGFDICAVDPADVIGFLEQVEFSQEEAEAVCDHVPGACDREWVPETCAEDLEATVFVQFGDEDEQRHVAEELFDIYNDLGAPFGEVDVEDIFVTVQEVFGIIGHYGAANVCDLISDVLSTEA